jgi:hypothetical protein
MVWRSIDVLHLDPIIERLGMKSEKASGLSGAILLWPKISRQTLPGTWP